MNPEERLVVLWTSKDPDVALRTCFLYALNSKRHRWWEDVTFIVWGPSTKLLCENQEIQALFGEMRSAGVTLEACKHCSDHYGLSGKLVEMGIDVKYMGVVLTKYIKEGRKVLTF